MVAPTENGIKINVPKRGWYQAFDIKHTDCLRSNMISVAWFQFWLNTVASLLSIARLKSKQSFPRAMTQTKSLGHFTNLSEWGGDQRCQASERSGTRPGWWTCGRVPWRLDSPGRQLEPRCSSRSGTGPLEACRAPGGQRSPQPTGPAESRYFYCRCVTEGLALQNELTDSLRVCGGQLIHIHVAAFIQSRLKSGLEKARRNKKIILCLC